jgi:menaquinone-9 beta-reductase
MTAVEQAPVLDEAEVLVVGAGPGGSVCAARLAELGRDVLLIDQREFPRDKACGDALDPLALRHLELLDLGERAAGTAPALGVRGVFDFTRIRSKRYERRPGTPWPARVWPRMTLDEAVLEAACERGARFALARADEEQLVDGVVRGLRVRVDGRDGIIRARWLVAADGVTSRLRRRLRPSRPPHSGTAHAVRQYVRTEKPLEPFLDFYVPFEHDGVAMHGYGWVFPVEEHLANVGVGYFHVTSLASPAPIQRLLDGFVERLERHAGDRLGALEPIDRPLGSPVAVGFEREACQLENVVFLGDAARTTDPLTGEGIGNAMETGRIVAELVDAAARTRRPKIDVGGELGRRFPRLGQNTGMLARLGLRAIAGAGGESMSARREDTLPVFRRLLLSLEPFDPAWERSEVARALAESDPRVVEPLADVGRRALDLGAISYPFISELLARELTAGAGPVPAALVLSAASACGSPLGEDVRGLALSLSCNMSAVRSVLVEVVDRPRTRTARAQNASIVLFSDFVGSRAWHGVRALPSEFAQEVARWQLQACKGFLTGYQHRYDIDEPRERYDLLGDRIFGGLGATAVGLAARLAGADPALEAPLREVGRQISRAHEVATSLRDLLDGDPVAERPRALEARLGFYSLPVILAARDPAVRRLLVRGVETDEVDELIAAVEAAGGVEASVAVCRERAERAKELLEPLELERTAGIAALADLAVERASAPRAAPAAAGDAVPAPPA